MNIRWQEATPPAGGAAFDEILIAGAMAGAVIAFFGWVVLMERLDKPTFVSRLADWAARISQLPRWVALPVALGIVSILSAGFGVWWDVPIHMQNGRDEGPLANPSHYAIFLGILGFTHAGILSLGLARDPLPRRTLKLAPSWRVPMGGLVITGAGLIALIGFPMDDLWHRLFGQDVTEWGPTHVMMIGGAVTFVLGFPLLMAEAAQVGAPATRGILGRLLVGMAICICGIPFAFLMEFDLGVPQFPAVTQFIIFAFLVTWIGTAARLWIGPGGALLASVLYLITHGFLWVTVWLLPDVLTARFLLMVPSAIIIEIVAAVMRPRMGNKRAVPFVLVSAVLVGTLGMYAEWLWSKLFMPLPQPFGANTLPLFLAAATAAAIGGGLLALWLVVRVRATAHHEAPTEHPPYRWFGLAGLVIFVGLMAAFAVPKDGAPHTVTVTYSDVTTGGEDCAEGTEKCLAKVTVKVDDPQAIEDAVWFYSLSWQGNPKGATDVPRDPEEDVPGIVRSPLLPTGTPGEYTTKYPVPLYGTWKTMLRLHEQPDVLLTIPLYMPDDPAITQPKGRLVTVSNGAEVKTSHEPQFLQRERKDDVPRWWFTVGYAIVILMWLSLLLFYGWCYNRDASPVGPRPVREKATA